MKNITLTLAAAASLLAAPAFAEHDGRDGSAFDYGKVVRAEPIYRQVRIAEPHEECFEEPVTERTVHRAHSDPGAMLIGGIIGGVIGHQFGSGRGNDAATVAGALIGASHAAQRHHHPRRVVERTTYETTCRTVRHARFEDRIDGYDVTYKYRGRLYHTRMPYHPGERVKVRVDVAPVYEGYED